MDVKKHQYITVIDYLEREAYSEVKHEYEGGKVLAMGGRTIKHGILCGNIYSEIRRRLEDNQSDCKVFGTEIKIHIEEKYSFVYPDAMVICGEIEVSEKDENSVVNPKLIVEVLSKSTGNYDRGDKFHKYRKLASFREYLLISQDKAVVEIFYKSEDKRWEILRIAGIDKQFKLKSIGISIKLKDLYRNVNL